MSQNGGPGHWLSGFQRASSNFGGQEIETKVVGVTFENRQSVIRQMRAGERVYLCREPDNPHDRNAIRVERQTGEQVGYIARHEAAALALAFDAYGRPIAAVVTAITGATYHDSSLGVRIRFTVPEAGENHGPVMPALDEIDDERM